MEGTIYAAERPNVAQVAQQSKTKSIRIIFHSFDGKNRKNIVEVLGGFIPLFVDKFTGFPFVPVRQPFFFSFNSTSISLVSILRCWKSEISCG